MQNRSLFLLLTVLLGFLTTGCESPSSLEQVKQRGVLNVATRSGPSTYHPDLIGQDGFEYQLAREFAEYLDVDLNMFSVNGRDDVFRALKHGKAHIAAAGLITSQGRLDRVRFSSSYYHAQARVVYKLGDRKPREMEDLYKKRIAVGADSYFQELLLQFQQSHPELVFSNSYDMETIDLLQQVQDGELDFTVVSEHEFIAHRGIFPQLSLGMKLGEERQLGWAMLRNRGLSADMYGAVDDFMSGLKKSGRLDQLHERYFSHFREIDQAGALEFANKVNNRLPLYEQLIREVATEYNIPWELLAAISYQESHWNPDAVSPTGVRGMMMLTKATARQVNIEDRENLQQSLRGGAEYFRSMTKKVPEDVAEPDRTWFALAAYNVGFGHLEDARRLTEDQGFDPHIWVDVKEHLPLLTKRKWYSRTRYGYARGHEPVRYVQNIRHFYQVLRMHEIALNRSRPPLEMSHRAPDELNFRIRTI